MQVISGNVDTGKKYLKSLEKREREKVCDLDWEKLYCSNPIDPEAAFLAFTEEHEGLKQKLFRKSNRYARRRAYEALRGKKRGDKFEGGTLARLRVIAGEPLELRRINLDELPEVAHLLYDIFAQHDQEKINAAFDALAKKVSMFWGVFERGRVSGKNHFHVFVKPGTCTLGVSNGIVPDNELVKKAAYFYKALEWVSAVDGEPWYANVLALLLVQIDNPSANNVTRIGYRGLGNARTQAFSFQRVLEIFGNQILPKIEIKPKLGYVGGKDKPTPTPAVALPIEAHGSPPANTLQAQTWTRRENPKTWTRRESESLPELRGADGKVYEDILRLKNFWVSGWFDGIPGRIGVARTSDMGAALKHYFSRSWLAEGEVEDLHNLSLGLRDVGLTYYRVDTAEASSVDLIEFFEAPQSLQQGVAA